MDITLSQRQKIVEIDKRVAWIFSNSSNNEILVKSLYDVIDDLINIVSALNSDDLNELCKEYHEFYRAIKLLGLMGSRKQGNITSETSNAESFDKFTLETIGFEDENTVTELNKIIRDSLLKLKKITDDDLSQRKHYISIVKGFLSGIISTTVDLVEATNPGSAPLIYADVEAVAKLGGIEAIKDFHSKHDSIQYSVSDIAPNNSEAGMNYLGQQLSVALFKGLHELPMSLRNEEMMLRGIEALLANVLHEKFEDISHRVLDDFCKHVHHCLNNLEGRFKNILQRSH